LWRRGYPNTDSNYDDSLGIVGLLSSGKAKETSVAAVIVYHPDRRSAV
jgi:hypothetical protein